MYKGHHFNVVIIIIIMINNYFRSVPLRRIINPEPADYGAEEEDIMKSKHSDNRDDRYIIDSDGEYSIKDAKGVFVMYGILYYFIVIKIISDLNRYIITGFCRTGG